MSLADDILALSQSGKIPSPFRLADLLPHFQGRYPKGYVRTALASLARDSDDYLKRWNKPRFRRVAPGVYEIIETGRLK